MKRLKSLLRHSRKYRTGVVLGGGGVRGFAHAGILKALNESGIYPDAISGVSAGAIVGAFYADGYSPDEMYEIFSSNKSFFNYARITLPKTGLFRTEGLRENISSNLRAKTFEELKTPLHIAATGLNQGRIAYFNRGELLDKILASAAIPVLFEPVEIDGTCYVDGGVLDSFPVGPIEKDCRSLIGISLNPIKAEDDFDNLIRIAERTFHLSATLDIYKKKARCDLVIEPGELAEYPILDAPKAQELFDLGYQKAKEKLKKGI